MFVYLFVCLLCCYLVVFVCFVICCVPLGFTFKSFRLPLTRIYAQYFGGRMHLVSMQGHGVDVYLKLKQLQHVEDLQI